MKTNVRILIVDDDRLMVKTLADIIKINGFETDTAYSGAEAISKIEKTNLESETPYDCVLTDIKMPQMNGVELYYAIKKVQPDLKVVLMTAYTPNSVVDEALEKGAIATLKKPLEISLLLSFFEALRKECSVIIVDDDPAFCKTIGDVLSLRGFEVTKVTNPPELMEKLSPSRQIVLLDMKFNGITGLDLLKQIREVYPLLPVVLVTGYQNEMAEIIQDCLNVHAYQCLSKPVDIDNLLGILKKLQIRDLAMILGRRFAKGK